MYTKIRATPICMKRKICGAISRIYHIIIMLCISLFSYNLHFFHIQ